MGKQNKIISTNKVINVILICDNYDLAINIQNILLDKNMIAGCQMMEINSKYFWNKELFNKILNTASIYLGPSYSEGFCLTLAEAMQCGCVPVCTNIGGYTVLCKDRETGLTGEVGNAESLAETLIEVIDNDALRLYLANNSYAFISKFTWERAYANFKQALNIK